LDVAALSGPPFYALVLPGGMTFNGGTNASAPLWAVLIGRVNAELPESKRQRFLTPLLYGSGANDQTLGQDVCRDRIRADRLEASGVGPTR
jgi:kumamolisin